MEECIGSHQKLEKAKKVSKVESERKARNGTDSLRSLEKKLSDVYKHNKA